MTQSVLPFFSFAESVLRLRRIARQFNPQNKNRWCSTPLHFHSSYHRKQNILIFKFCLVQYMIRLFYLLILHILVTIATCKSHLCNSIKTCIFCIGAVWNTYKYTWTTLRNSRQERVHRPRQSKRMSTTRHEECQFYFGVT